MVDSIAWRPLSALFFGSLAPVNLFSGKQAQALCLQTPIFQETAISFSLEPSLDGVQWTLSSG